MFVDSNKTPIPQKSLTITLISALKMYDKKRQQGKNNIQDNIQIKEWH